MTRVCVLGVASTDPERDMFRLQMIVGGIENSVSKCFLFFFFLSPLFVYFAVSSCINECATQGWRGPFLDFSLGIISMNRLSCSCSYKQVVAGRQNIE